MARSFNTLKASDVITTPIRLKYSQSYDINSMVSNGIQILTGTNGTLSKTGSYSQEFLNFVSVRNLYYMNYLSGSLLNSSSYFEWYPQSTAASGTFDDDYRYFPTESNAGVKIISVPRSQFGERISKNSFQISSSNFNIVDDGNGNIVDVSGSTTHVGNIIYNQGIVVVTNQDYLSIFNPPTSFTTLTLSPVSNSFGTLSPTGSITLLDSTGTTPIVTYNFSSSITNYNGDNVFTSSYQGPYVITGSAYNSNTVNALRLEFTSSDAAPSVGFNTFTANNIGPTSPIGGSTITGSFITIKFIPSL